MKHLLMLAGLSLAAAIALNAQDRPITLRIGTLLDGKGGVLHNTTIVVRGSKIEKVGGVAGAAEYDLRKLTVLPGLIDTHVHIAWHLGPDGKYMPRDNSPAEGMGYGLENAYVTLMAGFTAVQSIGSPIDKDIRDAINRGVMPGPRILTSIRGINNAKLSVEELREAVRKAKEDGADVIKIFASTGPVANGGGKR